MKSILGKIGFESEEGFGESSVHERLSMFKEFPRAVCLGH